MFFEGTHWGSLHLHPAPELHPFLPANSEDSENLWSQYTVEFPVGWLCCGQIFIEQNVISLISVL